MYTHNSTSKQLPPFVQTHPNQSEPNTKKHQQIRQSNNLSCSSKNCKTGSPHGGHSPLQAKLFKPFGTTLVIIGGFVPWVFCTSNLTPVVSWCLRPEWCLIDVVIEFRMPWTSSNAWEHAHQSSTSLMRSHTFSFLQIHHKLNCSSCGRIFFWLASSWTCATPMTYEAWTGVHNAKSKGNATKIATVNRGNSRSFSLLLRTTCVINNHIIIIIIVIYLSCCPDSNYHKPCSRFTIARNTSIHITNTETTKHSKHPLNNNTWAPL